MWPFKKKGIVNIDNSNMLSKMLSSIQPGESKDLFFEIPKDKEIEEIVLNYDDKYGNKYETRVLVNFKEKKIMSQSYKMIKKVKDCPEEDRPRLVVHEKDLENYLKKN